MIALYVHDDFVLAGISIPPHRTLEVVDELPLLDSDEERDVLTPGEARALVQAGYADPIEPDFDELARLIEDWQRT